MLFFFSALIGVLVTLGILVLVTRKMSDLIIHLADTSARLQNSNLN